MCYKSKHEHEQMILKFTFYNSRARDLVIIVNIDIVPIITVCYHTAEERELNEDEDILKHRGGHDENQSRCDVIRIRMDFYTQKNQIQQKS